MTILTFLLSYLLVFSDFDFNFLYLNLLLFSGEPRAGHLLPSNHTHLLGTPHAVHIGKKPKKKLKNRPTTDQQKTNMGLAQSVIYHYTCLHSSIQNINGLNWIARITPGLFKILCEIKLYCFSPLLVQNYKM